MPSKAKPNPVDLAIAAAGGMRALARTLGVSAPSVFEWRKRKSIPAKRVLQIEAKTGIPRHELRPDIYPADEYRAA